MSFSERQLSASVCIVAHILEKATPERGLFPKGVAHLHPGIRKYIFIAGIFLSIFLAARYLLPLFLPILLGASLALAAEPLVQFLTGRLRIKRWIATGIGVSVAFSFLVLILL